MCLNVTVWFSLMDPNARTERNLLPNRLKIGRHQATAATERMVILTAAVAAVAAVVIAFIPRQTIFDGLPRDFITVNRHIRTKKLQQIPVTFDDVDHGRHRNYL